MICAQYGPKLMKNRISIYSYLRGHQTDYSYCNCYKIDIGTFFICLFYTNNKNVFILFIEVHYAKKSKN